MITTKQYKSLDDAYAYFNKKLFGNKLPDCMITLQRHAKAFGFLHPDKFADRETGAPISELALNPDKFADRSDMEILATVAHEMCHIQQIMFGDPPRRGYHDKEFAALMGNIGLQVSSTGEAGGAITGQHMHHYIIDGGKFEITAGAFLLGEKKLLVNSLPEIKEKKERKKTRIKYTCPECGVNMWGKKGANIMCGDCEETLVPEDED